MIRIMDNHDLSLHGQQFINTCLKSFSQKVLTNKTIMLFAHKILNKNMTPPYLYGIFFISLLSPLLHRHSLCYPQPSSASTQTHYPRLSPSALSSLYLWFTSPIFSLSTSTAPSFAFYLTASLSTHSLLLLTHTLLVSL